MFDSSFFFHLFPIMFRYIDVTLGISLAALLLALLIAVVIAAAYYLNIPGLKQVCAAWVSLSAGRRCWRSFSGSATDCRR